MRLSEVFFVRGRVVPVGLRLGSDEVEGHSGLAHREVGGSVGVVAFVSDLSTVVLGLKRALGRVVREGERIGKL